MVLKVFYLLSGKNYRWRTLPCRPRPTCGGSDGGCGGGGGGGGALLVPQLFRGAVSFGFSSSTGWPSSVHVVLHRLWSCRETENKTSVRNILSTAEVGRVSKQSCQISTKVLSSFLRWDPAARFQTAACCGGAGGRCPTWQTSSGSFFNCASISVKSPNRWIRRFCWEM